METLKDLLDPKTFNKVSYCAVICWIAIGLIFFGIFLEMEIAESRFDFHCGGANTEDINLVRGQCFELYEKQYNKHSTSLPIYAFVVLNFFLVVSVCAIYSLKVSPTVDKLSTNALNGDQGQSRDRENASSGKKLFIAYCLQLFTRIVFGVLFMVLQTQFLYPTDFPSRFRCDPNSGGNQPRNSIGAMQNSTSILHDCHNQRATKKNSWMRAILAVNGFFALVVLMEAVYILLRAWKKDSFMKNSKFVKAHLNPSRGNSQNASTSTGLNATSSIGVTQNLLQIEESTDDEMNIPPLQRESDQLPTTQLQKFTEERKKKIVEDTGLPPQLLAPFSGIPGEGQPAKHLTLDQIYPNLVVVPDRATYDFAGDRQEKLKVYARSAEKTTTPRGPEDILNHENKKVLITSRPGMGKTLFCSKILRDWASNEVFCKTRKRSLQRRVAEEKGAKESHLLAD